MEIMSSEIVALPVKDEFDDLLKSFSTSDTGYDQPAILADGFYSKFKSFYEGAAKAFRAVEEKRKEGNIVTYEHLMGTQKNLIDYYDELLFRDLNEAHVYLHTQVLHNEGKWDRKTGEALGAGLGRFFAVIEVGLASSYVEGNVNRIAKKIEKQILSFAGELAQTKNLFIGKKIRNRLLRLYKRPKDKYQKELVEWVIEQFKE